MEKVEELKNMANSSFKASHFHEADDFYTQSITELKVLMNSVSSDDVDTIKKLNETYAIILSNRAMNRLRLEEYGWAINDATEALEKNPNYIKAYYRRGSARFAIGKYKDALGDFKIVAKLIPDKDNTAKLKECERLMKQQAFAKAIAEEDPHSVFESVDAFAYEIEDTYDGPWKNKMMMIPTKNENSTTSSKHCVFGFDDTLVQQLSARYEQTDLEICLEDCMELIEKYKNSKKLHIHFLLRMLVKAYIQFTCCPNIVTVPIASDGDSDGGPTEITVCGDTHGQFYDLMKIFEINGYPSSKNPYVFNGDFVDRGSWSVEVIVTLLCFKLYDNSCMYLTRGNHESLNMNKIYGFEGEVKAKYNETVFNVFLEVFRSLPLAFILDGAAKSNSKNGKKALVLHGGLFSKDGVTLSELQKLNRNQEPDSGLMAEMLWSDPQKELGWGASKRGIGVAFGPDVTHRFLELNSLDLIVRSHEMKDEGYEVEADGKLITIFSAPNYCDQMGNKGAFIRFKSDMVPKFIQFSASPHPEMRPMAYAPNLGMYGLT
mmetsp:Transcript_11030/g.19937  ORF Transcript_11030/g.19937 Transcript_11030/m.19937 type:complete len:546 (-) Transcript_11030:1220-2857(-)|eukprot:CAMPEP_0182444418 /NCGR_PEP_ID=MMETSP1172-20130603/2873_1 /TAXON_ID=708627 /ORGANISM="Timspurckia oligopyrenoides, Strain CCMP3278" /LENGTH=545 /DNA_ID=CAMNT_0024639967 /DNA_START=73 /DNA_END=1710 /DNA_ORIENTATION=-